MSAPLNVAFGQVLKQLRQERGITQEQLAAASGYHWTYISQLERGLKNPTLLALFHFAEVMDIAPEEIVRRVRERAGVVSKRSDHRGEV
jgi:transcriptional regulator with XRE-family HTH domain